MISGPTTSQAKDLGVVTFISLWNNKDDGVSKATLLLARNDKRNRPLDPPMFSMCQGITVTSRGTTSVGNRGGLLTYGSGLC